MYAVISAGGKQHKVEKGQLIEIDRLVAAEGDEVALTPVLLVDGADVLATPDQLDGATVTAKVVGESKGPKVVGFTYKRRTNQRRHYGHRQKYTTVEIVSINGK